MASSLLASSLSSPPGQQPPNPTRSTSPAVVRLISCFPFARRVDPRAAIYKGTVNDPTTFPTPSRMHGSHHWSFERLLSAALIPLTGAAFATSPSVHPVLDGLLGVSLVIHSHIGFDSMVVDYLHPRKFCVLGPLATWTLRSATVGVLLGVYQFNTNDIGLTELISKVWSA
ncbi:CybS-domain-containing protein [Mycena latifolia]|nr:CybS-domain-containing protein [Mycena latifolia]